MARVTTLSSETVSSSQKRDNNAENREEVSAVSYREFVQ